MRGAARRRKLSLCSIAPKRRRSMVWASRGGAGSGGYRDEGETGTGGRGAGTGRGDIGGGGGLSGRRRNRRAGCGRAAGERLQGGNQQGQPRRSADQQRRRGDLVQDPLLWVPLDAPVRGGGVPRGL